MGRLVDILLRKLTRTGMRRGLAGEHRAWLLIAVVAYVLTRARHPSEHTERIDLRRGDRYLVTLLPRTGRRGARTSAERQGAAAEIAGGAEDAYQPHPTVG